MFITDVARKLSGYQRHASLFTALMMGIFFLWLGVLKFYPYEYEAVSGLMTTNPLTNWLVVLFANRGAVAIIGVAEIIGGILLLAGLRSPLAGFVGSAIASVSLFVTSTFLIFAPVIQTGHSFPALSGSLGQFLLKDPVLLGAAIWLMLDFASKLDRSEA